MNNTYFQQALTAFQNNELVLSERLCLKILKKNKKEQNTNHLLALIYKRHEKLVLAKKHFLLSLKVNPKQDSVLSNYANLLCQMDDMVQADTYYKKACQLNPQLIDAWYNWANMLNSLERYKAAEEKIQKAINLDPNNSNYYLTLGVSLRGQEKFEQAVLAFNKAKNRTNEPHQLVLITQNLALTYRSMHQATKAIDCLQELIEANVINSDVFYVKACAHYDNDELEHTERNLLKAIELEPNNINAHEALNKLYWESERDENFLASYKTALLKIPNSEPLLSAYISQLILANKYSEAKDEIDKAEAVIGKKSALIYSRSQIARYENDLDSEFLLLSQLLKIDPKNIRVNIDKANILIKTQKYKLALKELESAGQLAPLNQEIWATKGTCWRLLGDPKAEWLNDYQRFISAEVISAPIGYDNLEHFFTELKAALYDQHKTNRQPLDQSVQNGTQTVGNLLTIPNKVIQDYRVVLTKRIKSYIDNLPREMDHPFLNRITQGFRHSGAWSVKLQSGGFHSNHMHPQGWLSNCTYVNVPKNIYKTDVQKKGWIKFGETCLELSERENIAKYVCPEEGVSILFPSYFWHGTVPFESQEFRITLPSDIMPVI